MLSVSHLEAAQYTHSLIHWSCSQVWCVYLWRPFWTECSSRCRVASLGPILWPSGLQRQNALPAGRQSPATWRGAKLGGEICTEKNIKQDERAVILKKDFNSTYLSDPSFTLTLAYKTSTVAGSSFMYSIPVTSRGRGFPSVMSLKEDINNLISVLQNSHKIY